MNTIKKNITKGKGDENIGEKIKTISDAASENKPTSYHKNWRTKKLMGIPITTIFGVLLSIIGVATIIVLLLDTYGVSIEGELEFTGGEQPVFVTYDGTNLIEAVTTITTMDFSTMEAGKTGTYTHTLSNVGTERWDVEFDLSSLPDMTTGIWEGITFAIYEEGTTTPLSTFQLPSETSVSFDYYYSVDPLFLQPDPVVPYLFDLDIILNIVNWESSSMGVFSIHTVDATSTQVVAMSENVNLLVTDLSDVEIFTVDNILGNWDILGTCTVTAPGTEIRIAGDVGDTAFLTPKNVLGHDLTEYKASVELGISGGSVIQQGMIFGVHDASNYYKVVLDRNTQPDIRVISVVDDIETILDTYPNVLIDGYVSMQVIVTATEVDVTVECVNLGTTTL